MEDTRHIECRSKIIKLLCFFLVIVIVIFSVSFFKNKYVWTFEETISIVEIILIALGFLGTIYSIKQSNQNQAQELQMKVIEYTNDFVKNFRKNMDDLNRHSQIKETYYNSDENMNKVMNNIKECRRLKFTREFIESLIPKEYNYDKLSRYTSVYNEDDNDKELIETYTDICVKFYQFESFNEQTYFYATTKQYLDRKDSIDKEMKNYIAKVKSGEVKFTGTIDGQIRKLTKEYNQKLYNLKKRYVLSLRVKDGEILNDMETLLFNANFDLLDHDKLYHLIVVPFKYYIQIFYLDLAISKINGELKGRTIYSNIDNFYQKIVKIEERHLEKVKKARDESDKAYSTVRNNH